MKKLLNKNWRLIFDDKNIPANVPGDITIDLFNAGLVHNAYFADNYKYISSDNYFDMEKVMKNISLTLTSLLSN